MNQDSAHFKQNDKQINSELRNTEIDEFEAQLGDKPNSIDELNFQIDVEQAIAEQDIISLRKKLTLIIHEQHITEDNENETNGESFSFGLAEEFLKKEYDVATMSDEEILKFRHSFPKIHLYQHRIAERENVHQFYKEQFENASENKNYEEINPAEEALLADIKTAIEEDDIIDLRANLKQLAQNMPTHNYSIEDIENYIFDEMPFETRQEFEKELAINADLAKEVSMSMEIEQAGAETDIMQLRASLSAIQRNVKLSKEYKRIENFINGELSEEKAEALEAKMKSDKELFNNVRLQKEIDSALKETDIIHLRNKLRNIANEAASTKQSKQVISVKLGTRKRILAISSVAASLIFLLGMSGILNKQSTADVYQDFYTKYEATGTVRSSNIVTNKTLSEALMKFENQDYKAALVLFNQVIKDEPSNIAGHFYSGVTLQETGKYSNAIRDYETVIINKDNLFIEQAEWYTGLCYLQINEKRRAIQQFNKIAMKNGFYQTKAQEILKKLKRSK